jgi:hypothetical protein
MVCVSLDVEVYADFGRAMTFRVESSRDQYSVGVDTVGKEGNCEFQKSPN